MFTCFYVGKGVGALTIVALLLLLLLLLMTMMEVANVIMCYARKDTQTANKPYK